MNRDFSIPRSELSRLIDEWIFSERNRAILKRNWLDGVTYEAVAEEFSLSARQVGNIISKCKVQLEKHISI